MIGSSPAMAMQPGREQNLALTAPGKLNAFCRSPGVLPSGVARSTAPSQSPSLQGCTLWPASWCSRSSSNCRSARSTQSSLPKSCTVICHIGVASNPSVKAVWRHRLEWETAWPPALPDWSPRRWAAAATAVTPSASAKKRIARGACAAADTLMDDGPPCLQGTREDTHRPASR